MEITVINNCLLLVRNILHIPDKPGLKSPSAQRCSHQNQILWNLFAQVNNQIAIPISITLSHVSQSSIYPPFLFHIVAIRLLDGLLLLSSHQTTTQRHFIFQQLHRSLPLSQQPVILYSFLLKHYTMSIQFLLILSNQSAALHVT